ncbi:hypothetical protein sce3500 [Sorangium cellulosum So ce56]|uniref:RNA polymerase sigma-70 region 2 domain-containing protein n=2 Tax=Polyangiaceae TaxID=49 RepID=A9GRR4_SORC5|nr:hypothetical protein sce3500 [Sorangium cellulosum So ce56]
MRRAVRFPTNPEELPAILGMSTHVPPADATRSATWNSVHTAALQTLPRSLRLLGVAAPDIDDLVQDVLLAAYESLDRFDPDYPASASPPPPREADSAVDPPRQAPEPGPGAPVIETPHRPCPAAPRAVPRAREASERDDTFAEELRLLTAARERLTAGDPAGALRQIAVHEQRFPGGQLKNVRERLRTVALARVAAPEQGATGSEPSR